MLFADIEFDKELFSAANKLRGRIAPSEYKNHVLPLLFLRFLSLKYEHRRILQRIEEKTDKKDNNEEIQKILENKAEYLKVNVFYIPQNTSWDFLLENADSEIIKELIDNAMTILETEYNELKGALPKIYKYSLALH